MINTRAVARARRRHKSATSHESTRDDARLFERRALSAAPAGQWPARKVDRSVGGHVFALFRESRRDSERRVPTDKPGRESRPAHAGHRNSRRGNIINGIMAGEKRPSSFRQRTCRVIERARQKRCRTSPLEQTVRGSVNTSRHGSVIARINTKLYVQRCN